MTFDSSWKKLKCKQTIHHLDVFLFILLIGNLVVKDKSGNAGDMREGKEEGRSNLKTCTSNTVPFPVCSFFLTVLAACIDTGKVQITLQLCCVWTEQELSS